jgi:hypothetical protein
MMELSDLLNALMRENVDSRGYIPMGSAWQVTIWSITEIIPATSVVPGV